MSGLWPYLELALIAWAAVAAMMTVLFLLALAKNNFSVVDPGWTFGIFLSGVVYALLAGGDPWRKAMFLVMTGVWASRLGLYLLVTRIWGHPEEGRYQQLRKDWASHMNLKFFVFFQVQGLSDVILATPFLLAAMNPSHALSAFEYAGFGLWAAAMIGEAVADAQLNGFKSDPSNKGKTCRTGLWNYSRHPNYFFEWMIWVAWFVFALGSPHGWLAIVCPALMLHFIVNVTGIPPTEAQSLRSRGDDYRQYQRTTSAFVPWFKKNPEKNPDAREAAAQ
jgi:steroid 5-alpha reductase family enzyme